MTAPVLTVTMTAYQHAPWIEQSVASVLAQQTDFPFDIVIGEDCSADGTREILRRLAAEAPGRIRLVLPERNLGNRGNTLFGLVLRESHGRYLAFLDGDDYWTHTDKLQRQVTMLERDRTLAICAHQAEVLLPDGTFAEPYTALDQPERSGFRELTLDNFIPSCSAVIRAEAFSDLPPGWADQPFGDWALYLAAARHGDVAFLHAPLGVYRLHGAGAWSGLSRREQLDLTLEFLDRLPTWLGVPSRSTAPARARRLLELAGVRAAEGDLRGARRAFVEGLIAHPSLRGLPPGLARGAIRAALGLASVARPRPGG